MDKVDKDKIAEIDAELAAYVKAIQHDDGAGFDAKAAHVDELLRRRMRAMGLPEDEIVRIELESEAAVDQQIADEQAVRDHGEKNKP
jgi:hypothetical protein